MSTQSEVSKEATHRIGEIQGRVYVIDKGTGRPVSMREGTEVVIHWPTADSKGRKRSCAIVCNLQHPDDPPKQPPISFMIPGQEFPVSVSKLQGCELLFGSLPAARES